MIEKTTAPPKQNKIPKHRPILLYNNTIFEYIFQSSEYNLLFLWDWGAVTVEM